MRFVRYVGGWLIAPQRLFALAGLCAAAGGMWGYATVQENANRTLALRQGPPAAVAVEDYRAAVHGGPAGEVVLRAAADPDRPLLLTMPGTGERALAVPLFPLGEGEGAMGAILLPLAPGESLPEADRLAARVADGAVEVNGRAVDAGDFALILAGALAVEGRHMGDRFVAVAPYVEGREAALEPVTNLSRLWLWPLGAAVVLSLLACYLQFGGGLRFAPRRRAGRARPAPVPAPRVSEHFAPLPRQEEVNEPAPAPMAPVLAALRAVLGVTAAALRLLLRLTAATLRLLWAGVEEIRSSR